MRSKSRNLYMPLYTYVISFNGNTYVSQSSHSNFRGFISWVDVVKDISSALKQELAQKAYRGEFYAIENKKHIWRKSIDLGGHELVVHAIQTQI